jgi:hypothetical protein
MAVSGLGVAYAATGFVLLWSGVKNATLKDTLTSFLKGQAPAANPTGAPTIGVSVPAAAASSVTSSSGAGSSSVTATGGTVSGTSAKANQAVAMAAAALYGWTGSQWTALNNVELAEAGWNSLALNAGSGAFGIAQALGHGTAGTGGKYGNQYGANYGLSTSEAIAANNGSAGPQIKWMLGYIKSRWGSPEAAWANEQSAHWY